MTQATTIKGGKVRVFIGNDADPIVYSNLCGLTSRSIDLKKGTSDERIPDCGAPDKVDWLARNATSLAFDIDGEGVLAAESISTWYDAWQSVNPVNVKIELVFPDTTFTWTGKMLVDTFKITASNGETVKASISMKSDGEMVVAKTPTASQGSDL